MHGIICQQRNRPARRRLERQHRQTGVNRTRRTHKIGVLIARVHVRANGQLAKRVVPKAIGPQNPSPAVCVFCVIGHGPSGAGRLETLHGAFNGLHDLPSKKRRVFRIRIRAQRPHHRRGRVAVCGRNEHLVRGNSRALGCGLFYPVKPLTRHHQRINHGDHKTMFTVIQRERASVQCPICACCCGGEKATADEDGERARCNVHHVSTGPQGSGRSHRVRG